MTDKWCILHCLCKVRRGAWDTGIFYWIFSITDSSEDVLSPLCAHVCIHSSCTCLNWWLPLFRWMAWLLCGIRQPPSPHTPAYVHGTLVSSGHWSWNGLNKVISLLLRVYGNTAVGYPKCKLQRPPLCLWNTITF